MVPNKRSACFYLTTRSADVSQVDGSEQPDTVVVTRMTGVPYWYGSPFFLCNKNQGGCAIIRIRKGKAKTKSVVPKELINTQISAQTVRLIDQNNQQIGIVDRREALRLAEAAGLDLVEVSPKAEPPVCRIMEFGKYYYQKERQAREAKKNQHVVQIKEIKFGPSTEDHDYAFKKNNAYKFLKHHDKVKLTVRFRGRQLAHKELGIELLNRLREDLKEYADLDREIQHEARTVSLILSPRKDIDKIVSAQEPEENTPSGG
jgi:translation initiation factor IF-3